MKIKDLRAKDKKELEGLLLENRGKLRDLRFKVSSKQMKGVRELRKLKKSIAQLLTILREKYYDTKTSKN